VALPDLTLVTPTRELLAQALEWRHHPDVTRWLMRTTVDPERWTQAWLDSVDDPFDAGFVAVLAGRAVATGTLEVRDGSGQDGCEATYERTEGLLGYLVDPAYAGRGIATAVARALLDTAFGELGLRRVTAGCFADNVASWRVMEKLGMRREQHGVADSFHAELGWVDGFTYGILAEEWRG
jgi:RimJ/RimL family protein N-acetyltransferase